jgi:hypothetical protein
VAMMLLTACHRPVKTDLPALGSISADRRVTRQPDGTWTATDAWMQDRYMLERALRLRAERCDATPPPGGHP